MVLSVAMYSFVRLMNHNVIDEIGRGTYGIISTAILNGNHGTLVAIKRVNQDDLDIKNTKDRETLQKRIKSLNNEARVLSCLDHPTIIKLFGQQPDSRALVLELAADVTLKEKLKHKRFNPIQRIRILHQV
jgi:hypothetical protein